MFSTPVFLCAALAAVSPLTAAHGSVSSVTMAAKSYDGPLPAGPVIASVVRQIDDIDPIKDPSSSNMTCGRGASPSASEIATVAAGSGVSFTWRSGIPGTNWQHQFGPIMSYMARCPGTADKCDPSTLKFFKISQDGLQPSPESTSAPTWLQADMLRGLAVNTTIPAQLPAGDYLIRHEIIALHNAMNPGGAEFYPSCTQVHVTGGGSALPTADQLVSFPGAYSATDPGILINVFPSANGPLKTYPFPGPSVFGATAGSTASGSASSPSASAKPKKCKTQKHKRLQSRMRRRV